MLLSSENLKDGFSVIGKLNKTLPKTAQTQNL